MTKDFVHLHVHSHHSMLDGIASPTALLDKAKELNMRAIAMTDHGTMASHLEAQLEADRIGDIKVIFGVEAYIVKDHTVHSKEQRGAGHVTLLAKNERGYKNLLALNNTAWRDGFYYSPRLDYSLLERYRRGIICLTGCAKGVIAEHILSGNLKRAEKVLLKLSKIFGKNLYLELQFISVYGDNKKVNLQEGINDVLVLFAEKHDVKLVVTNDVHFLNKGQDKLQTRFVRIQREDFAYAAPDNWLKTRDEIKKAWKKHCPSIEWEHVKKGLNNTVEIADKCNYKIPAEGTFNIPYFDHTKHPNFRPGLEGKHKFFASLLMDKMEEFGYVDEEQYCERLAVEFALITKLKVVDYFLIVDDLFRYARSCGVLYHTRGSVNGSLIAFLLGFGCVDPIRHGILFERFLSPARLLTGKSDIDIDCDFEAEFRDKAIRYLKRKYGEDRVCQVGSYNRMQLKAAIKDMGKIEYEDTGDEDFAFQNLNKITKGMYTNDPDREQYDEAFADWFSDHKKWFENFVLPVVGSPRAFSGHPAGVVITPTSIDKWVPIRTQRDKNTDSRIAATSWENSHTGREDLFARGLMCLDCLGVKTLSIISKTIRDINLSCKSDLKFEDIPIDDSKTMETFKRGETLGVFQLSAPKITAIIKDMQPDRFEDIIALGAIDRPGPLMAKAHESYADRKHGREPVDYIHKSLKHVLGDTYGVPIYSEHAMLMCTEFAGMDMVDAERMRQVTKAKTPEEFKKFGKELFKKAEQKWGKKIRPVAEEVWGAIKAFGGYAFPKAHSTAYAYYGNATQYLKVHYPIFFFKNHLDYATHDEYAEIRRIARGVYGLKFKMPNVNLSKVGFSIASERIVWALNAVKGVGDKAAAEIVEKQPFTDFEDFFKRVNKRIVNKRVIEALVAVKAFGDFGNRRYIMKRYCELKGEKIDNRLKWMKHTNQDWKMIASELLGFDLIDISKLLKKGSHKRHKVKNYTEFEGAVEQSRVAVAGRITKVFKHKTKNGKEMMFIDLDVDGMEVPVVCWPDTLDILKKDHKGDLPKKGSFAILGGVKGERNNRPQVQMEPSEFFYERLT